MTEEQQIVYMKGILLQAEIRLHAMVAANKEREMRGESPAYGEEAFLKLVDDHGVHHNAIMECFYPYPYR